MKILSPLIIAFLLTLSLQADFENNDLNVQCPASHFHYTGNFTLGKQDELNRTFAYIQPRLTDIGEVTYSQNNTVYKIWNTKPTFYYRDSTQRAEILGSDTIVIRDGKLQVDITFNWSKTNVITRNGTGTALGLSDPIAFVKSLVVQNTSSYDFQLLDCDNVSFTGGQVFQLTRVDPGDTTIDDKTALTRMFNNIMNVKTIRLLLEEEIDKMYCYYLRNSLHDQHHHIDSQFDYDWNPGRNQSNITISMMRRPISISLEKDGLYTTFDIQAENAGQWQCGSRQLPMLHLNQQTYGHLQEFVSYDFYENMLRLAVQKKYLDVDLSRTLWQSRMFQFFVGDLYEVFPGLQKYPASTQVDGNCRATYSGLKIDRNGHDTFNVSIHFDCQLNVKKQKFVNFAVGLTMEVRGMPDTKHMNFKLVAHDQFVSWYPYGSYNIQNEDLATLMVSHSLNRVYEANLFGSGFPVSPPRDYPHMIANENYTIVYDSTHIDPNAPHTSDNIIEIDGEEIELMNSELMI